MVTAYLNIIRIGGRGLVFSSLALLLLTVVLCSSALAGDYVIGEGDTLQVSVWGEKELSHSVKVRPDGKITLPALGEVTAAGMTPSELQVILQKKVQGIVKNAIVTVIVSDVTNNKVYVFGSGVRSGLYSLTQRTTLLQLLCQVGQQTASGGGQSFDVASQIADLKNAFVVRGGKKIKRDFYDLFVNGQTSDDMVLEPNDAIYIPAYRDRNIYIMGAVATPKAIAYRNEMTVVEAILEAGGFTKFANKNNTVIYRRNGTKKGTSIPIKVKDLINDGDLSQNTALQPGDYVVVYESLF